MANYFSSIKLKKKNLIRINSWLTMDDTLTQYWTTHCDKIILRQNVALTIKKWLISMQLISVNCTMSI